MPTFTIDYIWITAIHEGRLTSQIETPGIEVMYLVELFYADRNGASVREIATDGKQWHGVNSDRLIPLPHWATQEMKDAITKAIKNRTTDLIIPISWYREDAH